MKLSKIISLVLSFVFVFTSVIACFPGSSASASTIALTDDDIKNASAVMKTICPDFPLETNETTTRGEFVAALTLALNLPVDTSGVSGFTDVPKTHPYAKHISYAASMGIISNVALFYPDNNVTYAQAIKMVMAAAGYDKKAQYSGGFPTGYLKAAKDAGVGEGLTLGMDDDVSHELATRLIFEACCIDMMEQKSFGTANDYGITEGKNIFSEYHKVYMAEGIVEANENTGLDLASQALDAGRIKVDGVQYKADIPGNLIGKRIRLFFDKENGNKVIYAYEKGNVQTVYTNEDAITPNGFSLTAYPADAEKSKVHSLETDYKVIYNGKAYIDDLSKVLSLSSGTITLIDNDDNNIVDVIYIREISYGIIGSINSLEGKIFDKYKKNGLIDLSDDDVSYSITEQDGTELKLENLEVDNKIGYVMSNDKKYVEIIRCNDAIGGTLTARGADGKIELKGKEYKLSSYYKENIKIADNLKLGTEVILYLSPDNQVIFIQEYSASLSYGFLVAIAQGSGLGSNVMVRLFTQSGQMLEAPVSAKLIYDGTTETSKQTIYSLLDGVLSQQYAYRVVKFSQNADGEINKIYTAIKGSGSISSIYRQPIDEARPVIYYDSTEVTGEISDDGAVKVPYKIEEAKCPYHSRGAFTPYFHAGSGTKIMRIPVRPAQFEDDDNFKILSSAPDKYSRTVAYDVSYGGIASFVLLSNDTAAGSIGKYDGSAIIESITEGVNEDGEVLTILKLFYGGEWDKYYYHPEKTQITSDADGDEGTKVQTKLSIKDFAPGDIIRISADADKNIAEMTMNFDASEKRVADALTQSSKNGGRYVEYITGYALGYDNSRLMLATNITSIDPVVASDGDVDVANTYSGTLTRGTTVFVKFHRNRITGKISTAEVYKEADASVMETYFNSGKNADYVVLRQYFRDPTLNVIYVNIDE